MWGRILMPGVDTRTQSRPLGTGSPGTGVCVNWVVCKNFMTLIFLSVVLVMLDEADNSKGSSGPFVFQI